MGAAELVVCDTNVLVSAFGWRGPEWKVYRRVRRGHLALALSPALLDELTRVLGYPKFALEPGDIDGVLGNVRSHARIVRPRSVPTLIEEDPSDNEVLACAESAGADSIVSGDRHLLDLEEYAGIPIVTARELLERLDPLS